VDQPVGVDRGQRRRHPDGEPLQVRGGQRAAGRHHPVQPDAVDVLGDQVGDRPVEVRVEHSGGAEPGHPPGRPHLAPKSVEEGRVAGQLGADDLDRHPRSGRPAGQVNGAHPAATQPPDHPVRPDLGRLARPGRPAADRPTISTGESVGQPLLAFDSDHPHRAERPAAQVSPKPSHPVLCRIQR
jgi:hypothetical protein